MLKSKGIEALKDLSGLVWVGAVVLARDPSQQVDPVIAPADLHLRVCSRDSLQRLLSFSLLEGCLNLCQEAVWVRRKQIEMVSVY